MPCWNPVVDPALDVRVGVVVERAVPGRQRVRVAVDRRLGDHDVRVRQVGDAEVADRPGSLLREVRVGVRRTRRVARGGLRKPGDVVRVIDPDPAELVLRVGDEVLGAARVGLVVLGLDARPVSPAHLRDEVGHPLAGAVGIAGERRARRPLGDRLARARAAGSESALLAPAPVDDVDLRRGLDTSAVVGHVAGVRKGRGRELREAARRERRRKQSVLRAWRCRRLQ